MRTLIFIITVFLSNILCGQAEFQRTYGSDGADQAYSILQSFDNNYLISGSYETDGAETSLFLLFKVDSNGDTLWTKTFGLTKDTSALALSNERDLPGIQAFDMKETADSGIVLVGFAHDLTFGKDDIYIVRTDSLGDTLWTRSYGGAFDDVAYGVVELPDSGFIVVGHTESFAAEIRDAYILRLKSNGDTLWTRILRGPSVEGLKSVIATSDGNFVAIGNTFSYGAGNADLLLVKFDGNGTILWQRVYGGALSDFGNEIIESGGSYFAAGSTESFGLGMEDAYLLNVSSDGVLLWSKNYGQANFDGFNSIIERTSGNFCFAGYSSSLGLGFSDALIAEIDYSGNLIWSRIIGRNGF